jgi:F-type H+-transporting ATPase subunit epsilon
MVDYRRPFRCEVITPRGRAFAAELVSAIFPAPDGLVGVLGGRGPLVTLLGSGPFTARQLSGSPSVYYVAGGFARFHDNVLTLLADECLPIREIDPETAWQEIERAQQMPRGTPQDDELREEALEAARHKFKLAQKHRKETGEL